MDELIRESSWPEITKVCTLEIKELKETKLDFEDCCQIKKEEALAKLYWKRGSAYEQLKEFRLVNKKNQKKNICGEGIKIYNGTHTHTYTNK